MGELIPLPVRRPATPEPSPGPERGDPHPAPSPQRGTPRPPLPAEPLWRESIGRELRHERLASGRRLVDVAQEAGVSPQYLSEVERGLKDPSSELLAAMAGALGLAVGTLATRVGSASPQSPVRLAA